MYIRTCIYMCILYICIRTSVYIKRCETDKSETLVGFVLDIIVSGKVIIKYRNLL